MDSILSTNLPNNLSNVLSSNLTIPTTPTNQIIQKSTKIFVMRHAETEKNRTKRSNSGSDIYDKNSSLNDIGSFHSMKMGEYLKLNYSMDAIYCSPALRSLKTAELLVEFMDSADINIHIDNRLYNFDDEKNKIKLKAEIDSLMKSIYSKYNGKNILLITHNHIIDIIHRTFVHNLSNEQIENIPKYKVNNCSLSCLNISPINDDNSIFKASIEFWDKNLRTTYSLMD